MQALQTLVAAQKVAYDFEFFALDQPADAPVTVLSLGRSLLKDCIDLTLPLRPTAPLGAPACRALRALCLHACCCMRHPNVGTASAALGAQPVTLCHRQQTAHSASPGCSRRGERGVGGSLG